MATLYRLLSNLYYRLSGSIRHIRIAGKLQEKGVPQLLIWLVSKLYQNATQDIRLKAPQTDEFYMGNVVRQGSLLLPVLFNFCGEQILRNVSSQVEDDV